jgi:uncharacterized repeat protein (TIGR03803 family)
LKDWTWLPKSAPTSSPYPQYPIDKPWRCRILPPVTFSVHRFNWILGLALVWGAWVTTAASQTYRVLYRFDGAHGCNPAYPGLVAQGRDGNLYGTTQCGGSGNFGNAFKITPTGVFKELFDFDWTRGAYPTAGLTLGRDGNLYGTASQGGTSGDGTVFKVTPSGILTTLYDFTLGTDGGNPLAPPVQGADGNFYGTTGSGTAYRLTSLGVFTSLGSIPGSSSAPLIQGSDGNFYGTTTNGGSFGAGTVFQLSPAGALAVVYNFSGTDGSAPYAPLVQGLDGNYYGTTLGGGAFNAGVVFRVTRDGVLTVLHNFDFGNSDGGTLCTAGLVLGGGTVFYGVAAGGGTNGSGTFFQITSDGTYAVLYNFRQSTGSAPYATPMQHTNARIYGLTNTGGSRNSLGVTYGIDLALPSFVKLIPAAGRIGMKVGVLGNGLSGTTSVSFNGTSATFTISSDTFLTATVPTGATTGFVVVTRPAGTLTSNTKFRVIPHAARPNGN